VYWLPWSEWCTTSAGLLVVTAMSSASSTKRRGIYLNLQRLVLEQVPVCFLVKRTQAYEMRQNVQGFSSLPGQLNFYSGFTLEDAYLS